MDRNTLSPSRHPTDLAKLIRKLRWIGLEQEAHGLELILRDLRGGEMGEVFVGAFETD